MAGSWGLKGASASWSGSRRLQLARKHATVGVKNAPLSVQIATLIGKTVVALSCLFRDNPVDHRIDNRGLND